MEESPKKKHKKRKRKEREESSDSSPRHDKDVKENESCRHEKKKKKKKKESKEKKRKRHAETEKDTTTNGQKAGHHETDTDTRDDDKASQLSFPHRYILAPMVGASELAFRLLCRQYGTQLAYTPMMAADKFAHDETYRRQEFQTCPADRPLVCHFCANTPQDFVDAAIAAEPYCDAIDLNLGCPQRTAYLGHFGSYLLDDADRDLVCRMVSAASQAVSIPIFCKIRLLDTLEATIQLCRQLQDAGAKLIAIHARYRASWERKGPGARDGPALLDQVTAIKQHLHIPVVANGNTITYDDVEQNLGSTAADGLMSAEGILDNPALFLPRLGTPDDDKKTTNLVPLLVPRIELPSDNDTTNNSHEKSSNYLHHPEATASSDESAKKKKERKLNKKLREIRRLEEKMQHNRETILTSEEKEKLSKKSKIEKELNALLQQAAGANAAESKKQSSRQSTATIIATDQQVVSLGQLHQAAQDKVLLAHQYLDLATKYPVKMRSIIFHTRRILKDLLTRYQLLDACLAAESLADIRQVLYKITGYQRNPTSFVFDQAKEKAQKEALERKKREEGKRKAFEARMMRKAKREGRTDLQHYLHQGTAVPSQALVQKLRQIPRDEALRLWKEKHGQHCLAFHLDITGCTRGRACAFLHVDVLTSTTFNEQDEVAG